MALKPNLGSLQIHRSGAAPRPAEAGGAVPASMPAPSAPAEQQKAPHSMPVARPMVPERPAPEPRRALTLKLKESDYQRLRRLAFDRDEDHQTIMERAVLRLLDEEGA